MLYKSEQFIIACKQNTDKLLKITTFFWYSMLIFMILQLKSI